MSLGVSTCGKRFMPGSRVDMEGNLWMEGRHVGRLARRFLDELHKSACWLVSVNVRLCADNIYRGSVPAMPKLHYIQPLILAPRGVIVLNDNAPQIEQDILLEEVAMGEDIQMDVVIHNGGNCPRCVALDYAGPACPRCGTDRPEGM